MPPLRLVCTEVVLGWDVDLSRWDTLVLSLLLADQPLCLQSGHASRTGRGDGLSVLLILDITGGEDTLDRSLGGSGHSHNVAVLVAVDLSLDKSSGGLVT